MNSDFVRNCFPHIIVVVVQNNLIVFQTFRPSSNQKGVISMTVCGWHIWILLCIPVARILWDFDFLRGLAPGCLDGSIERYEKNSESFDVYAPKFESGGMRFWGEKSPRRWNPFKTRFPPLSF